MTEANWSFSTLDNLHLLVVTRMLQYLLLRPKVLNQETLRQAAVDNNLGTRWSNRGYWFMDQARPWRPEYGL